MASKLSQRPNLSRLDKRPQQGFLPAPGKFFTWRRRNDKRTGSFGKGLSGIMGLTPIKDIRRQELLDAAFMSIKKRGIQATTIASIAAEAGVSKGTIHHYYKNREELIEIAVRRIFSMRHAAVMNKLKSAKTSSERLWAVISVNLDPQYLEPGFCRAWISIAAEATENMRFARLLRLHHAREKSNLVDALRKLKHEPDVNSIALGLKLLFEGARHRAGFLSKKLTPEQETEHMLTYLKACVPTFHLAASKVDWRHHPENDL